MNEKEAYYYLFNEITHLIKKLQEMQSIAEAFCICDLPCQENLGGLLKKEACHVPSSEKILPLFK